MDWTTPLKAQQLDFIQRLKSGSLLNSETKGQHSELTVISGERLRKLKDFCWEMAEKYKRTSPVRDIFINNLKGKLGEEVVKARLANIVTEVDYEKRLIGDGKVDFIMTSDSSIGIQVKTRHSSVDQARWLIKSEEVQKNAVLVCILIQEEVNESQDKYNMVFAGFLPTNIINLSNNEAWIGINELLYSSGLKTYLQHLEADNCPFLDDEIEINSTHIEPSELSITISCGSWSYRLPLQELLSLETEIQKITQQKKEINSEILNFNIQPSQELELKQVWYEVLNNIQDPPRKALLRQMSFLKSFDSEQAHIIFRSEVWLKSKKAYTINLIEDAFLKIFNYKGKIVLEANEFLFNTNTIVNYFNAIIIPSLDIFNKQQLFFLELNTSRTELLKDIQAIFNNHSNKFGFPVVIIYKQEDKQHFIYLEQVRMLDNQKTMEAFEKHKLKVYLSHNIS